MIPRPHLQKFRFPSPVSYSCGVRAWVPVFMWMPLCESVLAHMCRPEVSFWCCPSDVVYLVLLMVFFGGGLFIHLFFVSLNPHFHVESGTPT